MKGQKTKDSGRMAVRGWEERENMEGGGFGVWKDKRRGYTMCRFCVSVFYVIALLALNRNPFLSVSLSLSLSLSSLVLLLKRTQT